MSETVSKDILDGVRLLETEFKRNAINGTGGSRLAWDGRAKLARLIAKEIEIDRAEITKLKSQLEEARAKAIEECAGVLYGMRSQRRDREIELKELGQYGLGGLDTLDEAIKSIRALLSAPTEARSVLEASNQGGE